VSEPDEHEHLHRPAGSPAARRFDPPVRATRWVAQRALRWDEFVRDAGARAGLDDAGLARVVHHGGFWLDTKPAGLESPPREVREGVHVAVYAMAYEPEPVPLADDVIRFDRDGVVVANKPAWLPVQGTRASQRISFERELQRKLDCPELRAVHRLDRQTSGAVMLARDAKTAGELGRRLQERRIQREYLALVSPPPKEDEFVVTGPLGPAKTPPRFRFELRERAARDTRPSETRFRVSERTGQRALLVCAPKTGRTHQLRVHLASVGAPICGDDLYGPPWREGAPSSAARVQLHAWRIEWGGRGGRVQLEIEPPADFESLHSG
jgi:RluA family pseudouridine synthase